MEFRPPVFHFNKRPYILVFYIGIDHPVATKHRLAIAIATKFTKIEKNIYENARQTKIPSPKQKQKHQTIAHSLSRYRSTITIYHRLFYRNIPEMSPTHHWKIPKTSPKNQQNNIKKNRDITKKTETRPNTKTWPRLHLDITKITPRHYNNNKT